MKTKIYTRLLLCGEVFATVHFEAKMTTRFCSRVLRHTGNIDRYPDFRYTDNGLSHSVRCCIVVLAFDLRDAIIPRLFLSFRFSKLKAFVHKTDDGIYNIVARICNFRATVLKRSSLSSWNHFAQKNHKISFLRLSLVSFLQIVAQRVSHKRC